MLKITESDYPNITYIEIDGGVTREDAMKADAFIQENYGKDAEINALVYIKKLEDVSAGGLMKGMAVDVKHWNQYNNIALVADEDIMENAGKFADMLPGINVESFGKTETEEAWDWLKA